MVELVAAKTVPFDVGHDNVVAAAAEEVVLAATVLDAEVEVVAVDAEAELLRTKPQTFWLDTPALRTLFI